MALDIFCIDLSLDLCVLKFEKHELARRCQTLFVKGQTINIRAILFLLQLLNPAFVAL